jgi:hypothetical protein
MQIGLVELDVTDEEPEEGPGAQEVQLAEARVWTVLQDVVRLSNKVYDKTKVTVSEDVTRFAPGSGGEGSGSGSASSRTRRSAFSFAVIEMLDVSPMQKQLMLQVSSATGSSSNSTSDYMMFMYMHIIINVWSVCDCLC